MAVVFENNSSAVTTGSVTSANISYTPQAINSMLVVFVGMFGSGVRQFSVSDNIEGSTGWKEVKQYNPDQYVGIFYKENIPNGITTITVQQTGATAAWVMVCAEFSGMGNNVGLDATDSNTDPSSSSTHFGSAFGISSPTVSDLVVVAAGQLEATATECSPGSGYNEVPTGFANNNKLFQYKIISGPAILEKGGWTNTGTARVANSIIGILSQGSTQTGLPFISSIGAKRAFR